MSEQDKKCPNVWHQSPDECPGCGGLRLAEERAREEIAKLGSRARCNRQHLEALKAELEQARTLLKAAIKIHVDLRAEVESLKRDLAQTRDRDIASSDIFL